jgi:MHS family proline/betaine transporter-like MFS transporter
MMKGKSFFSTLVVATVQYYDYYLYGLMAATLAKHFFVDTSKTGGSSQIMKAYIILALGMLARPLGAIVLGRLGDLYGRAATLKISLIGNSLFSLIIALTPGYELLGSISAFILLICKMSINVFSAAGTDGVRIYIYENIGREKQCLGNGFVIMATQIGSLLASLSAWLFTMDQYPPYSWRFAFIIGSLLGFLVAFNIGKKEASQAAKVSDKVINLDLSILKIVKSNLSLFTLCAILAGSIGATYQFNIIFFGTYCYEVIKIIDAYQMKKYITIAIILYMLFAVFAGFVADYYGRRKVAMLAFPIFIISCIANVFEIAEGQINPIYYFISTISMPFMLTPALSFLKQSIPVNIRYRIFSLAHSIGSIVISSTTPLISTYLYEKTHLNWVPIIYFIMLLSIITLVSHILCSKYKANEY